MNLHSIELENFRNYTAQTAVFSPQVNLICGENAQGKTNLLEAVSLLSTMRLFRSGQKRDGLRFDTNTARVRAEFTTQNRDFILEIRLFRTKTMEVFLNGSRQKRQADAAGLLRSVLFSPDDLYLVREGAAARRRFLDTALCQLRPRYAAALSQYQRLLEHKTRILRDYEEKPSLLELLDDFSFRMAGFGAQILSRRAHFIRALGEKAQEIHANIAGSGETLAVGYHTVSAVDDPFSAPSDIARQLYRHALAHRAAELAAHSCLSGPHKDDLTLQIDGRGAAFASQGQTRTCALALKLAEREVFRADSGEYPLLLLDDVMSELDRRRQDFVLNRIGGGQVFITCCEPDLAERITGGTVFNVTGGTLRQIPSNTL